MSLRPTSNICSPCNKNNSISSKPGNSNSNSNNTSSSTAVVAVVIDIELVVVAAAAISIAIAIATKLATATKYYIKRNKQNMYSGIRCFMCFVWNLNAFVCLCVDNEVDLQDLNSQNIIKRNKQQMYSGIKGFMFFEGILTIYLFVCLSGRWISRSALNIDCN